MSSAAARAEARRKAILSRGTDRLSKLTSSARGEDNPVYLHNEPQAQRISTTENFVGDESVMPTPPTSGQTPPLEASAPANDAGAWSQEEQREFLRALMAAPELTSGEQNNNQPSQFSQGFTASAVDDPMAAMMSALTQLSGQKPSGLGGVELPSDMNQTMLEPQARSFSVKLLPLVHLLSTWALLAFFVVFKEPQLYSTASHVNDDDGVLSRWAELAWRDAKGGFGVQSVQFFWAFVTLQLIIHSIQIFTKTDPIQPPTLLALALPHLPPRLQSFITNVLTYVKMVGTILDDIAGLIFGVGVLIWTAAWLSGRQ